MTPVEGLLDVVRAVGRTVTRETGVVACARCNMRLEYCDGAFPLGVCLGQVARRALAEWDARPALKCDIGLSLVLRDVGRAWDSPSATNLSRRMALEDAADAIEAHLLGPRTPATPGATETTGTTGGEI